MCRYMYIYYVHTGADLGGFVGFERTPLFVDSFDLPVLCNSQQCFTLSTGIPVQFGYCIVFPVQFNSMCMQLSNLFNFSVELSSRFIVQFMMGVVTPKVFGARRTPLLKFLDPPLCICIYMYIILFRSVFVIGDTGLCIF